MLSEVSVHLSTGGGILPVQILSRQVLSERGGVVLRPSDPTSSPFPMLGQVSGGAGEGLP